MSPRYTSVLNMEVVNLTINEVGWLMPWRYHDCPITSWMSTAPLGACQISGRLPNLNSNL
jgi:hypothetical protein